MGGSATKQIRRPVDRSRPPANGRPGSELVNQKNFIKQDIRYNGLFSPDIKLEDSGCAIQGVITGFRVGATFWVDDFKLGKMRLLRAKKHRIFHGRQYVMARPKIIGVLLKKTTFFRSLQSGSLHPKSTKDAYFLSSATFSGCAERIPI